MKHIQRCVCPYCHGDVTDAGTSKVLGQDIQFYECELCHSILEQNQLSDKSEVEE
jgi:hypothetical protein